MDKNNDKNNFFLKKVFGWEKDVSKSGKIVLTPFLSLSEQTILEHNIRSSNACVFLYGGYGLAERKRALIYPNDFNMCENDLSSFNIKLQKIDYNKKYLALEHKHILGTLTHSGINRNQIGDIFFNENKDVFFCVTNNMSKYIMDNIKAINGIPVNICYVDDFDGEVVDNSKISVILISSMRLDILVSRLGKYSRSQANALISDGVVTVNWSVMNRNTYLCKVGDVISIRQRGRFTLERLLGETKKEKIMLEVRHY